MDYKRKIFDFYSGSLKNDVGFFAIEVDFSIKIDNHKYEFWEYRDKLYHALYDKFEYRNKKDNENLLEFFFRDKLKRIAENKQITLFFTDYKEREGSFIITFSFLAFSAFMNYGQFRESLDYLKQDFNFLFRDVFPNDTTILVDYYDRPNHLLEDISENFFSRTYETMNRKLKSLKLIILYIGILGFSAFILSMYALDKIEKQPSQTTVESTIIQSTVRAEIEKINTEKNNEELLRLLKQNLEKTKIDDLNDSNNKKSSR